VMVKSLSSTDGPATKMGRPSRCTDGKPRWFFCPKVMADDKLLTKVVKVT
jgi:hypothetical protein